jgi:hypothetical protein
MSRQKTARHLLTPGEVSTVLAIASICRNPAIYG